jgi:hypothetical protein
MSCHYYYFFNNLLSVYVRCLCVMFIIYIWLQISTPLKYFVRCELPNTVHLHFTDI